MADYSSVLSRAIAGKKTSEERRVVYDRARTALVNQLRSLQPALPEADITRQRLALEESIRKVEAEAAADAAPAPASQAAPPRPPAPPPAQSAPSAPASMPPAPLATPAPALQAAPRLDPVQRQEPVLRPSLPPTPMEPARQPQEARGPLGEEVRRAEALGQATERAARSARDRLQDPSREPSYEPSRRRDDARREPEGEPALNRVRSLPATAPERPRPNRRPLVFALIAVLVLGATVGTGAFLWFQPGESERGRQAGAGREQPPKITDRVAQDTSAPPRAAPGQPAPPAGTQTATLAQTALLYEENADNARGADSFRGSVTWRVDIEAGASGPERIVRGLVEIPERGLKVLLTIRRNADQALPASHTVELLFQAEPSFPHGAVENVAGLRMKPSEQANGVPLVGAAARITEGYFLIGLSALGPDRERNLVLLRDRPWMDLPIVYRNGRRAVLAIEKGAPGEQAFEEAFNAWRS